MRMIRWLLGRLILAFDVLFRPRGVVRDASAQALVDTEAKGLILYQFKACPFCVKVRRSSQRLSVPLATRNVLENPQWHDELSDKGGRRKVPCLRIADAEGQHRWIYDSREIINYLELRFQAA